MIMNANNVWYILRILPSGGVHGERKQTRQISISNSTVAVSILLSVTEPLMCCYFTLNYGDVTNNSKFGSSHLSTQNQMQTLT